MQSTGHFFTQSPQPMQRGSDMTGKTVSFSVTMHSSPILLGGQTFSQTYPHLILMQMSLSITATRTTI